MKTTLTNNVASNYTVDNFKVKKLFWFLKIHAFVFFSIIVDWIPLFTNVLTSVFIMIVVILLLLILFLQGH